MRGTWLRRLALLSLLAATGLTALACSGGGSSSSPNAVLAGDWQYVSGPLVPNGGGLPAIGYLELATVGSGTLFVSSRLGTPGCEPVAFGVSGDQVVLDLPDFPGSDGYLHLDRYTLAGDTLTFTDLEGVATVFQRVASVPAASRCGEAPVPRTLPVSISRIPDFGLNPGLAADASELWFTPGDQGALAINPLTGSTGAFLALSSAGQYTYVEAVVGQDFWTLCNCPAPLSLERITMDTAGHLVQVLDLSTVTPRISVAYVTVSGSELWVGGIDVSGGTAFVGLIDPTTSPPTLRNEIRLDQVGGLAFRNGELFVLDRFVGPELLELTTGGTLQAVYNLPRLGSYSGLAEQGGTLYTLRMGNDYTEPTAAVVALSPP